MTENGFRHDEAFAAGVVRHVLGAEVVQLDVSGAPPRTVDGEIRYPDGRTAALEVTNLMSTADLQLQSIWLRCQLGVGGNKPFYQGFLDVGRAGLEPATQGL